MATAQQLRGWIKLQERHVKNTTVKNRPAAENVLRDLQARLAAELQLQADLDRMESRARTQ